MATEYCTKCGEKYAATDNFCSKCGSKKNVQKSAKINQPQDDLYRPIGKSKGASNARKTKSDENENEIILTTKDFDELHREDERHKKAMKIVLIVLVLIGLTYFIATPDQGGTSGNNNNGTSDQSKLQYCVAVSERLGYTTQDAIAHCNLFK